MYAQHTGKTAQIFHVTDVRLHSDEKPFGCDSCDKFFSWTLMSEHTRLRNLWLPLIWQEIFRTLMSKYTQMKNHLAATHVTRIFLNSYKKKFSKMHSHEKSFGCHLCDKKLTELTCQNTLRWKPYGCTQYSCDFQMVLMFIQMWEFGKFLVTKVQIAAKWLFITVYFDLGVCKNPLSHE